MGAGAEREVEPAAAGRAEAETVVATEAVARVEAAPDAATVVRAPLEAAAETAAAKVEWAEMAGAVEVRVATGVVAPSSS